MAKLRILYQDEYLVAIDKPPGFYVHPPEDDRHPIPKHQSCLHILRDQIGTYVHPAHRIDRATSGIVLFALSSEVASGIQKQFQDFSIKKTYVAVARGWVLGSQGERLREIDRPLDGKESRTSCETLATIEIPVSVGRYEASRYSLLRVSPHTGRTHQIRRHLAGLSHPLLGDTVHGDAGHNRAMEGWLGERALLLKAYGLEMKHPVTQVPLRLRSQWSGVWHRAFDFFKYCPWVVA